MIYTARVDHDLCLSSGKCVADAPEAFGFDDDQLAVPLAGVAQLTDERLVRIARRCPANAIELYDATGSPVDLDV